MPIGDKNNSANPDFWLNLAAEHIYNSADRRTASVEALKTVILWAFGIFSVGGFAVARFGELKDYHSSALVAFGIAFFMLTLAYYIASKAQFPKVETFRLADPVDIAKAYSNTVKSQAETFTIASSVTALGFFSLAIGILIQFNNVERNRQPMTPAASKSPLVRTGIANKGDSTFVPTTIEWEKSKPVTLTYIKLTTNKELKTHQETPILTQVLYTDTSGKIFYSYLLTAKDSIQNLIVRIRVIQKASNDKTEELVSSQILVVTK